MTFTLIDRVVIELKRVRGDRGETPEQALDSALTQVRERDYAAEVRAAGAGEVWIYGAAFDGKRVWVRTEGGPGSRKPTV